MTFSITSIVGARPQFIKASTVSRVLQCIPNVQEEIIHTGQHFNENMSGSFFQDLAIPCPSINLGINGGTHGNMTGRMLKAVEAVLIEKRPGCVLVYGDTNSTLAGSLAAAKLGIPIAHVEAGLRSHLKTQPEEINRVVADRLSSLLLCPTRGAVSNLHKEGLFEGVFHVGDVMYDAACHAKSKLDHPRILDLLGVTPKRYCLATVHRAENTDKSESLAAVIEYLRAHAGNLPLVLPLHPRTRQAGEAFGLNFKPFKVCKPVGYFEMAALVINAATVFTDSGGLQKEAYFHGVPCVTLRDRTEWTELIDSGWNRLWTQPTYKQRKPIDDYGEGSAAANVVEKVVGILGRS